MRRILVSVPMSSGGMYSHVRNVLPRLIALRPDWRFEVHSPVEALRTTFGGTDAPWMRPRPRQGRGERLRWEFLDLPSLLRADPGALLLAPCGPFWNLGLARRAVVRLENMVVLLDRAERVISRADDRRLRILRHVYLAHARRALRPVVASLHSRARYVALTGLPPERFAVIPHGVDREHIERASPSPEVERLCSGKPFVLTVGQATPYRRIREAILAYRMLADRPAADLPPLVWAGSARAQDREYESECLRLLEPLRAAGQAIHLKQLWYEDVYVLDRSARLFVHPSVHEDCPNTIFEALAAGAPVICTDIPANLEFAGGAAHFISESTAPVIATAIEALLADGEQRAALSHAGRERARALSWDEAARRWAAMIEQAFAARDGSAFR